CCARLMSPRRRSPARSARRRSRRAPEQPREAQQVVSGASEVGAELRSFDASVARLSQPTDGLHPAEDLLDLLPASLAVPVPDLAREWRVDVRVLALPSDVRNDAFDVDIVHKVGGVVALVRAERGGQEALPF